MAKRNSMSERVVRERPACRDCGGYAILDKMCADCYIKRHGMPGDARDNIVTTNR